MAPPPAPPAVPWRTIMRERHVAAPREAAWAALLDLLGADPEDLSVEPPWRHVRRVPLPGIDLVETTVTLRDDGAECHLAWCAGLAAHPEDDAATAALIRMADDGEHLLDRVAEGVA